MHENSKRSFFSLNIAGVLLFAAGSAFAAGPATGGGTGGGGTVAAPCSWIQSLSVKAGYPPKGLNDIGAALWTTYSFQQCTPGIVAIAKFTVTDLDRGYVAGPWVLYLVAGKASGVFDDDCVYFNTNFRVDVVLTDPATGNVLDSRSVLTISPPPKPPTLGS
jgi:hypothetical protein